jgi:hypothetical protein
MKILEIPAADALWKWMVRRYPEFCCKLLYKKVRAKWLDLKHPESLVMLSEKIQYLKFHANQEEWARMADKYAVRSYVQERGLEEILVKLYGKWDTAEALIADWEKLPQKFVLKSNNGCGTVLLVKDKQSIDLKALHMKLNEWLRQTDIGIGSIELHYDRITPCLIAEELLEDESVNEWSGSLVDYKIFCFDGKPFGTLIVYNREGHHAPCDYYDLEWVRHPEFMTDKAPKHTVPCPKNYDKMLEIASRLSSGHPQMRVDLYNVNGKIYLGELTMTPNGGYMLSFTDDINTEMGKHCKITPPPKS